MDSIFRLRTFRLYLGFYGKYFWSLLIITLLLISFKSVTIIILSKILFIGLIYLISFETNLSGTLTIYHNFGISRARLFVVLFLLDSLITIIVFHIIDLIPQVEW